MIKKNIKVILAFLLGMIITIPSVYAVTKYLASDVIYGDTTVENALNELYDQNNNISCKKGSYYADDSCSTTEGCIIENHFEPTYFMLSNEGVGVVTYNAKINSTYYGYMDKSGTVRRTEFKGLYYIKNGALYAHNHSGGWLSKNIDYIVCK